MPRQLDILALEPFHGGARRAMLDAISRCSRHRWTILKLPPRNIERRLLVAATWFAEHLSRNDVGNVDLVFASEAMNLADLLRLRPELAGRPAVVYFHDNQLPDPAAAATAAGRSDTPTDLVNLNSATAATEVWFNSLYNLRTFLSRASAMVSRHKELAGRNPMADLTAKAHLIPPPIDLAAIHESTTGGFKAPADVLGDEPRSIVIDTRGADPAVLCDVLARLDRRPETVEVTLIGRPKNLPASMRPVMLGERDEPGHQRALLKAGVFVGARQTPPSSDDLLVRALAAGCHPVVPDAGVYPELLPKPLHPLCLHDGTVDAIVERILGAWFVEHPVATAANLDDVLSRHDAIRACKVIDERLNRLAGALTVLAGSLNHRPPPVTPRALATA
jgi:hypothetical protein